MFLSSAGTKECHDAPSAVATLFLPMPSLVHVEILLLHCPAWRNGCTPKYRGLEWGCIPRGGQGSPPAGMFPTPGKGFTLDPMSPFMDLEHDLTTMWI